MTKTFLFVIMSSTLAAIQAEDIAEKSAEGSLTTAETSALAALNDDFADTVLIAKSGVQSLLAKGFKPTACEKLAEQMCKEVLSEVRTQQKLINSGPDGSKCDGYGQEGLKKAEADHKRQLAKWTAAKKAVVKVENTKVEIERQQFSTLKKGQCGWIFRTRSYMAVHRRYKAAVMHELGMKGAKEESWKGVLFARRAAEREQKACRCRAKKARDTIWKTYTKRSTVTRQAKAYAKCRMMRCVLHHIPVHSAQCKTKLPKLRFRRLPPKVERAQCNAHQVTKKRV